MEKTDSTSLSTPQNNCAPSLRLKNVRRPKPELLYYMLYIAIWFIQKFADYVNQGIPDFWLRKTLVWDGHPYMVVAEEGKYSILHQYLSCRECPGYILKHRKIGGGDFSLILPYMRSRKYLELYSILQPQTDSPMSINSLASHHK